MLELNKEIELPDYMLDDLSTKGFSALLKDIKKDPDSIKSRNDSGVQTIIDSITTVINTLLFPNPIFLAFGITEAIGAGLKYKE